MKKSLLLCGALLFAMTFSQAELKIPSSVFTMDELEEAKAKAFEDEEPLIFVYTDPGTT